MENDELADLEWLMQLDREEAGEDMCFLSIQLMEGQLHLIVNGVAAKRPATKQDVRDLARLLGITLTGAA